jgi:hypothetical protein
MTFWKLDFENGFGPCILMGVHTLRPISNQNLTEKPNSITVYEIAI